MATPKGFKHTEEWKLQMSIIAKERGFGKWMVGKKQSEETKLKKREAMLGKVYGVETREKNRQAKTGENNPRWKGGKTLRNGHTFVLAKGHPYADKDGYVAEHRLVIEKHLVRYLKPDEVVHHINEIKTDNRICNLLLCDHRYHTSLHWKMRQQKGENN